MTDPDAPSPREPVGCEYLYIEIPFNNLPGGVTECKIPNDHSHRLIWHSQLFVEERLQKQKLRLFELFYVFRIFQ
ncbi:hypothetical protein SUGI_0110030 [Cryptomeria japonica]|nr:hypothetical protein SUGI_0110030 [Cryptomeria japonica]